MSFAPRGKKDPQEDIRKLNEVISSGQFKNVHLLCGDEDYLRLQFKDKLCKAMGGEPGSMSYDRFVGKDTVPEQIIDLAETLPFFADRRVILIENTGWFKNGCEAMEKYIDEGVCESTCIIFCEKEVDKRTKIYKAANSKGMISSFDVQDAQTLRAWIAGQVRKAGLEISGADAAHLIDMVGTDMVCLSNELEKVCSYCLGKGKVSSADIDAVCSRKLEDRVFDMIDAFALNKKERAFAMYFDLIGLREKPEKILVLLTRQYDLLMKIKGLETRGWSDKRIGDAVGKPDWTIKNYRAQTSRYSLKDLKQAVIMCADTDMSIKTGQMQESVAVETLLVSLAEKKYKI